MNLDINLPNSIIIRYLNGTDCSTECGWVAGARVDLADISSCLFPFYRPQRVYLDAWGTVRRQRRLASSRRV